MQPNRSNQQSDSRHNRRLLLSFGLPFLLVVIFAGFQFIDLDSIGWSHGFSHPLSGWDHLVTMLAVGIWAAQLRGQAVWMLPLAFVGVMSLGGLAGAAGLAIPSVEGIILLSCAVFGVLITRKIRFSAKINVMIVAFFCFLPWLCPWSGNFHICQSDFLYLGFYAGNAAAARCRYLSCKVSCILH